MRKRIFAWILLAGFVLLILNLLVIRLYWKESMIIYLIIVFAFMLTNGNIVNFGGKNQYNFEEMNPDIPDGTDVAEGEEIAGNSGVEADGIDVAENAEGTDGIAGAEMEDIKDSVDGNAVVETGDVDIEKKANETVDDITSDAADGTQEKKRK